MQPDSPQADARARLRQLLGWDRFSSSMAVADARSELRAPASGPSIEVEDLTFVLDTGESIPAYLVKPAGLAAGVRLPAVLYCHAHGKRYGIGRSELLEGRPALREAYAWDLVQRGCAALCMEMPCFGARSAASESAAAKACLWEGTSLFGKMLSELALGIGYLAGHPLIDSERIAALGMSMGGTHAWWLAALDSRLRAAASLCCFADLACLIKAGLHDGHGIYMTVGGLLREFSTGRIAGLATPTPQLFCVGLLDWSSPQDCFERARREVCEAYEAAQATDALSFCVEPDAGHQETPAMRAAVLEFLAKELSLA